MAGASITAAADTDTRIRLHDDGHVIVEHVAGSKPARRLVVTFSHYGSNDVTAPGYAERFLRTRGFDVLAVKTNRNDWFQTLSIEDMVNIRAMLPHYGRVTTYGSSMGGYAAIYFADAIGAATAIALSPQYSVDPAVMPGDGRWVADAANIVFTHRSIDDVVKDGTARLLVLYDPNNPDRLHVEAMSGAGPRLLPLPVHYGGHPVGVALHEIGILERIVVEILNGKVPDVRGRIRRNRRMSAQYMYSLALACIQKGHVQSADRLLTRAAKRGARSDILLEHSRLLLSQHKPGPALALLETALKTMVPDAHIFAYHAHLKEHCGDPRGALALFDQAIRLEPEVVVFYAAERALYKRIVKENTLKLDRSERMSAKIMAERALALGPVPGHYGVKEILGFTVLPVIVAGIVWMAARAIGLI
jgi:hypothetical protein